MALYRIAHGGRSIEVTTRFGNRCRLLVDGRQADSGRLNGFGGTTKLIDTGTWVVVNVTTGGFRPTVTLLADGAEFPIQRCG